MISKIDKNIHLSLHSTEKIPEDGSGNGPLTEPARYLIICASIKVQDFETVPMFLLLSENIAIDIFNITLEEESLSTQTRIDPKIIDVLATITLDQVIDTSYATMDISKTIGDAYDLMQEKKIDALPLIEKGKVVRVITKNNLEIIRSVFFDAPGQQERQKKILSMPLIKVCKDQKVISANLKDILKIVVQKMSAAKIQSIPIVDDAGNFAGMLTSLGLLKVLYS